MPDYFQNSYLWGLGQLDLLRQSGLTWEGLQGIANEISASLPADASGLIAYSGGIYDTRLAKIDSLDAAYALQTQNPSLAIISNTEVGQFLTSDAVKSAVEDLARFEALPESFASPGDALNYGLFAEASARVFAAAEVPIVGVVPQANSNSIFAQSELPAAVGTSNAPSIMGVPTTELAQMPIEDAFAAVKAASQAMLDSGAITIGEPYFGGGSPQIAFSQEFAAANGVEAGFTAKTLDPMEFSIQQPALGASQAAGAAGEQPPSSLESLTGAAPSIAVDTWGLAGKTLGGIGSALVIADTISTWNTVHQQELAGDNGGAILTGAEFGGRLSGAILGAEGGAALGGALAGPPGAVIGGLGGAIVGGYYGQQGVDAFFNRLGSGDPFAVASPTVENASLGGANFATVDMSGPGAFENVLNSAYTGAPSITPYMQTDVGANAFSNLQSPTVTYQGYSGFPGYESMPAQLESVTYPSIQYYTPTTVGQDLSRTYLGVDSSNYGFGGGQNQGAAAPSSETGASFAQAIAGGMARAAANPDGAKGVQVASADTGVRSDGSSSGGNGSSGTGQQGNGGGTGSGGDNPLAVSGSLNGYGTGYDPLTGGYSSGLGGGQNQGNVDGGGGAAIAAPGTAGTPATPTDVGGYGQDAGATALSGLSAAASPTGDAFSGTLTTATVGVGAAGDGQPFATVDFTPATAVAQTDPASANTLDPAATPAITGYQAAGGTNSGIAGGGTGYGGTGYGSGGGNPYASAYTPAMGTGSVGGYSYVTVGSLGGYGGSGGGSGGGGGGGGASPVVLDLSGKGIKITPLSSSNMFFNMKNNGYAQHTAWAGAGNGVLVYDPSGGPVTQANQVNFTLWDPTAKTDMQALRDVFDTNHDGVLNASDSSWNNFRILVTNADGTQTLETLAQAGVTSINLTPNSYTQAFTDGSSINGETTFTRTDGSTGTAATVTFAYDGGSYVMQQTVTHNGDGSTTLVNAAYNADGTLAETVTTNTSASGLNKTVTTADGSGIVLATQTDNTVVNGDGSTTETLTDANGSGVTLDKIVTTTSADGKTVTINRDPNGAGYTAQQEVDTANADGSTSVSLSDLTRNGTLIDKTVSSVSADGLTRTVASDFNGDGVTDLTHTDATVINGDGSRTETVTDTNSDGSLRSKTVTVTSANGLNSTVSVDSAGSGVFNLITTNAIVNNADGSTTTTQTNSANNGSKLGQTVTAISADGLTTTTQIDSAGSGTFNETIADSTTVDGSGNRTRTITEAGANGTVYGKQVIVHNADGKTGSASDYVNYGSGLVLTSNEMKTLDGSGNLVDAVTRYATNGTDIGQTVTTTSANGLVSTTQIDPSGAGVFDFTTTSTTVKNGDGSSTVTMAETAANGALIGKSVTNTSANSLSVTTQTDHTGSGSFDTTVTGNTTDNADGSVTETITKTSANGTLEGKRIVNTSADRSTVTTTAINGDGQTVQVNTAVTAPNGVTTDTLANYAPNGTLVNETVTAASANGLSITTQSDVNGDGIFDATTTDVTVLNTNGSRTETVTATSANGTQTDQTVTTTSANGLSKTATVNIDGKVDSTTTDNTVFNADGSSTETITKTSANGTVLGSTATTISGNGLSVTTQTDVNGDGVIDLTKTAATALNADGSKTLTVTEASTNGTVYAEQVNTHNADGVTGTANDYVNYGSGLVLTQSVTEAINASGALVNTVTRYAPNGTETGQTVSTTTANGLTGTVQVDPSGGGVFELTTTVAKVINSDGSSTVTRTGTSANGTLTGKTVTTTSANGLSVTTQTDHTGSGTFDTTDTDVTALNADGSTTETVTQTSANGTLEGQQIIATSSDRLTVTTTTKNGDGQTVRVDTAVTGANGAVTDTLANYNPDGSLKNKTVTTTSANGLSVTVQTDHAGSGTFDTTATDNTVINADGSRTETVTTTSANGTQTSQTVTTTSGNGLSKTSTVNIDGKVDYTTTDNTVINADGSSAETVTKKNANGAVISSTSITTSGNGLSVTTQTDENGDGIIDLTRTDVTVLNADGSKTETVTDVNGTSGSLRDQTVTTVNATGTSVSITRNTLGLGYNNQTETIATASNGSTADTVSNYAQNGSLIKQSVTTTAANGLTQTVQLDINGDGVFDQTQTTATVYNADGSTTVTRTETKGTTVTGSTVVTTAANGLSSTTSMYNGSGTLLDKRTDTKVINADGSTAETVADYSGNGTLLDQSVTTVSSDRKTTTIQSDNNGALSNGAPVYDQVETIAQQANGSIIDTTSDYSAGTLIAKSVKTTAANGLSWTLTQDQNGDGIVDNTQTDAIVLNADGSTTETYTNTDGAYNSDWWGNTASSTVVTTTSANGLNKTVVTTGMIVDSSDNNTLTDNTVINADGSKTETRTVTVPVNGTNQPWSTEIITTSANGLSQTMNLSENGDSYYDITDTLVTGVDGTRTETLNIYNWNGSLFEEDVTTTSANGQSISLQSARYGSTAFNHFETINTNADGSVTDTVWDTNSSGVTTGEVINTTSASGLSKTVQIQPDGGGVTEQSLSEVKTLNADGSTTLTQSVLNGNGTLRSQEVRTASANGLNVTTTYDVNGDGTVDETTTDNTVLNADGSKTETVTTAYASGTQKSQSVTTTSADGLNMASTLTVNGYATVTDTVSIDASGAKTETIDHRNGSGSLVNETVTLTNADGRYIEVDHYNSAHTLTAYETTITQAGAYGSYDWQYVDPATNTILYEANHMIDANGVDDIVLWVGNQQYGETLSVAQYSKELAIVDRLYNTLLNRAANSVESQTWLQYYTQSGLNATALANSILSSTEFAQKYGTLTNAQFVEQIYQNALGRNATMGELSSWLSQLSAGTATKASLAQAVSESAEHIADGNVYKVTNNTYNTSGTFTLDHTTDTAVANAIVQNLYETALARAASQAELSTYAGDLLNGSMTETQIAAALTSSSEFLSKYGSMSNADFVSQIFANGLGRLPTAAEASYWTAQLTSGAVSKADLVAAMSQSPDHLQTQNQQVTTLTVSGTGNTIHATGDTLNFAAGSGGTVDSTGNTLNLAPGVAITVNSSGEIINAAAGDTITFAANVTGTVNGSGATVYVASGDTVTFGANASNTVSGSGATLHVVSTDTITFAAGAADTVSGSGATANIATGDIITASNDIIAFLSGAAATVTGSGNTISLASGDTLTLSASSTDTINGSGAIINAATGDDITASNDTINVAANATVTIIGSGNVINAASGDSLTASNDTIVFGASATATVTGSGNTISAATGDRLTASGDTINFAASATDTLTGSNNTINVGKSDTLTVSGSNDAFVFIPAFGIDTINGFGSTDSMTFSVSDFANWAALQSHMTQTGNFFTGYNTVITLDASDKITLTGVTMSSLQSSQFHFQ